MLNASQQTLEGSPLPLPNILRGHGRPARDGPRDACADPPGNGSALNHAVGSADWKRLKAEILERDHHRCQLLLPGCESHASEIDHIGRPEVNGNGSRENLRAACKSCGRNKGRAFRLLD
jgi:hypothetical protein